MKSKFLSKRIVTAFRYRFMSFGYLAYNPAAEYWKDRNFPGTAAKIALAQMD